MQQAHSNRGRLRRERLSNGRLRKDLRTEIELVLGHQVLPWW